tara:strand:+ start:50 stop:451 length:402 start_codon:yes stop_codon:yes gene_type:complete
MTEILPLIITLGILVFGIFFLIKKRIDNKKETGNYFSFSFKKNPFLYVGLPFLILTIILYLIAGEDTIYSTISLMITYSIFLIWLFIYLPIKFFTNIKDKKVKKTKNFGGALVWILILSFMGFFLYVMIKAGV